MALKYSACYAEESATLVGYDRNTAMSVGKAVRVFKDRIPAESIDAVIREMWGARLYVNRPMIDRRGANSDEYRLTGLWRVADLRKNGPQEEGPAIIETLVYGWMTAGTNAATWAANDLESRLSAFREYNVTPVKDVMGINRTYLVVYPNVAYTSHKAFITALLARGDVVNPVFGKAATLTGTFLFTSAKAQETEDGGCMVVATLTLKGTTTDITNAAVSFASTWEKKEFRLFWTGLTALPGTLPPAVDMTVVGTINGTAYEVSGFDLDAESGTYTITYNKTQFIKSYEDSTWSSANGAPAVRNFWNFTKAELDADMLTFLTSAYHCNASWTKHPLIALYSGTLTRRPDISSSGSRWPAWKDTTCIRWAFTYHHNSAGAWKEVKWVIYYTMEQGTGQSTGIDHFKESGKPQVLGVPTAKTPMDVAACGAHSRFERISGDRYYYEAVWKVTSTARDVTSTSATTGYEGTTTNTVGEVTPTPSP